MLNTAVCIPNWLHIFHAVTAAKPHSHCLMCALQTLVCWFEQQMFKQNRWMETLLCLICTQTTQLLIRDNDKL